MPRPEDAADRSRPRERLNRVSIRFAVRLGALVLLLIPCVQYTAWYVIETGSFDGILSDAFFGAADSIVDAFNLAITDPGRFVLLVVLGTVTWRLAFGISHRRKWSIIGSLLSLNKR